MRKNRFRGTLLAVLMALGLTGLFAGSASAASPFYKIGYANWTNNYLVSPDGSNNVFVSSAGLGRWDWTPDGEKYVYTGSGRQVYLRNQNGAEFPIGTIEADDVELSPDGTKIAYVPKGGDVVNIADVQGNHIGTLGEGDQPTWSPDGKRIAYVKDVEREVGCDAPPGTPKATMLGKALFIGPSTGGQGSMVGEPFIEIGDNIWQWAGGSPDWSPDDTAIVVEGRAQKAVYVTSTNPYRCAIQDYNGLNYDVFKISPSGGNPVNITTDADWVGGSYSGEPISLNPSFSPDGQTIAFASNRDSPREGNIHSLWKMNANGSGAEVVRAEYRVDDTDWTTALPVGDVVRAKAPDNCATEERTTPGTITIERTGPTDGNLPVQIRVAATSTATSGSDFEPIPTTVTIPDGTDRVNLLVWPLDDNQPEPDEKIVVEIVSASGGLLVGEPSIATITIADNDGGDAGPCAATSDDPLPPRDDDPPDPDPDGVAPVGKAKPKSTSKAGKATKIKVSSNEAGTVKASGKQRQTSNPKRKKRAAALTVEASGKKRIKVKLKTVRAQLEANVAKTLKLKPKGKKQKKKAKKLKKLVKRGAKAKAALKVTFADEAGNISKKRLKIKLK